MKRRYFSSLSPKHRFGAYIAIAIMIAAVAASVLAVGMMIRQRNQTSSSNSQPDPDFAAVSTNASLIGSTNETTSSTEPISFAPR